MDRQWKIALTSQDDKLHAWIYANTFFYWKMWYTLYNVVTSYFCDIMRMLTQHEFVKLGVNLLWS